MDDFIFALEGNGTRPSHRGSGISEPNGNMFTLNTTEVHGAMYPDESILYYNHPQGSDVTEEKTNICQTLTQKMGTGGGNVPLVREPIFYDSHPMDSRVTPCNKNCQTLSTRFGGENDPNTILIREEKMNEKTHYVVRRITPKECERLQSFPDDWTNIPWPKGQCPDSHRYKALGNSMNCMVMFRIGQAIQFALDNHITEDKSEKIAYQTSLFDF